MILSMEHNLLVSGPDRETCEQHIRLFFAKSQLVHYDSIDFDRSLCLNGTDPRFQELVDSAVEGNRKILAELLAKLREDGCTSLDDLLVLPQGFMSKVLHTMCHLLDGFFGVDSRFFDIDEISHWLTENRRKELERAPELCWLMRVRGTSVYGQGFEDRED